MSAGRMLRELLQDIRYGARGLRRNPGFALTAALALALGIGANTAMFSVAYGILLRPLPYRDASRVTVVCMNFHPRDFKFGTMCLRDFQIWNEGNHAFEQPSLFSTSRMDIGGMGAAPEQTPGASVTAGFFRELGSRPLLGRVFAAGDDGPTAPSLVVLSEALWRRRFGADPGMVGKNIPIGGAPYTVIGVMPNGVSFPRPDTEVWTNLKLVPPSRFGPWFYRGLARLKPGVTLQQAQAEVNAIGGRMMRENPTYQRLTMPVIGLRDWIVGDVRKPLLVLICAVGLVLLIAVVNVANLVLARGTARNREMALRLSLGAGRGRLVRQLLVESALLSLAGGIAGMGLAAAAIRLLASWNPGNLPLMDYVRLDARALLFMLGVSLLTSVFFGLLPALQSSRADLHDAIKEGGRAGSAGRQRSRTRAALVVSEIALSLMLLLGAGLLFRSLGRLERVGGGFTAPAQQILSMTISPGDRRYQDPRVGVAFYNEVLRRAAAVPGVASAAVTDALPPDRQGDADTFGIEGESLAAGEMNPVVSDVTASAGYFRTLQIPLIRGRYFDEHDTAGSRLVTIISESMARRFFSGRDPIGLRLRQSGPGFGGDNWMEIVGIVGDVKYLGRKLDTDAAYYMPFGQSYSARMYLAVRTVKGASAVAPLLRREIQASNPLATVSQVSTMEQAMARDVAAPRFDTTLLGLFAAVALLMASVGIYGLIAYSVARRTQEIGVRIALGAQRGDVLRLVIGQAMLLAALGIGLGLAGAFVLTRLLKTLLFGTSATDPLTFALAPLVLLAVVLLAAAIPARRAARISAVVALRYE